MTIDAAGDVAPAKNSLGVFILGTSETLWMAARYIHLGGHGRIKAVMTRKSPLESNRTESDFRQLADESGAAFMISETIGDRETAFARRAEADVCVMLDWPQPSAEFISLFPRGAITAAFGDPLTRNGEDIDAWTILQGSAELRLSVRHFAAGGAAGLALRSVASTMSLTEQSTIADVRRFAEARLPNLFCEALAALADNGEPQPGGMVKMAGAKNYHSLSRLDGRIDWRDPATAIDAKIRAFTRPASGAYTYLRDVNGRLAVVYVWRARILADQQAGFAIPGQVVACNADDGDALVMTGDGVIALQFVSENIDGEWFGPGKAWTPDRTRLGLSIEDELFALLSREWGSPQGKRG